MPTDPIICTTGFDLIKLTPPHRSFAACAADSAIRDIAPCRQPITMLIAFGSDGMKEAIIDFDTRTGIYAVRCACGRVLLGRGPDWARSKAVPAALKQPGVRVPHKLDFSWKFSNNPQNFQHVAAIFMH